MSEKMTAERVLFEAALHETQLTHYGEEYSFLALQRNSLDEYSTVWVQAQWMGWKLARAQPAEQAAQPVARLQSEISDRPHSKGIEFFGIVVLDRERCTDGALLYLQPAEQASAGISRDLLRKALKDAELGRGSYHQNYDGNALGHAIEELLDAPLPALPPTQGE